MLLDRAQREWAWRCRALSVTQSTVGLNEGRDARHLRSAAIVVAAGILILLVHLAFYPWPASIPDMQDLHKQFDKQRHEQKKEKEPPPDAL